MKVNRYIADVAVAVSSCLLGQSLNTILSKASLFNSFDDRAEYTIGCHKSLVENYPKDCLTLVFALRDIAEGEELVTDYDEFSVAEWPHFGL